MIREICPHDCQVLCAHGLAISFGFFSNFVQVVLKQNSSTLAFPNGDRNSNKGQKADDYKKPVHQPDMAMSGIQFKAVCSC